MMTAAWYRGRVREAAPHNKRENVIVDVYKRQDLESEALLLGAAIRFRSFTREEVQRLIASVTG